MAVSHAFVCESDPEKRDFLSQQFGPRYSFGDVGDISKVSCTDTRTGSRVKVPFVNFFWAGFSCKSRARNTPPQSKKHVNCLQRKDLDAETSYTFFGVMDYVERARPRWVVLENVVGLLQRDDKLAISDADFALQENKKLIQKYILYIISYHLYILQYI